MPSRRVGSVDVMSEGRWGSVQDAGGRRSRHAAPPRLYLIGLVSTTSTTMAFPLREDMNTIEKLPGSLNVDTV